MKRRLTLKVVDLASDDGDIEQSLRDAAAFAFQLDGEGQRKPLDDFWRDRATKLLIARYPDHVVYKGGRHIALHAPPKNGKWGSRLGAIVEALEVREAVAA